MLQNKLKQEDDIYVKSMYLVFKPHKTLKRMEAFSIVLSNKYKWIPPFSHFKFTTFLKYL